jgi:hypothetical protein
MGMWSSLDRSLCRVWNMEDRDDRRGWVVGGGSCKNERIRGGHFHSRHSLFSPTSTM